MKKHIAHVCSRFAPQTINATFLVAGTCIGGGMLALPVATAMSGFFPSLFVMICAWLAMTCTGLYLIEVGSWMKKDEAHLISMSQQFLGSWGKGVSWLLYLFIAYASLVAYTAGGGHLIGKALLSWVGHEPELSTNCFFFLLFFGPLLFCSHIFLGKANAVLFVTMIIAYALLIALSLPNIDITLLKRYEWSGFYLTIPLFLTAFSFQTMVPSLHPYLNHHLPSLRFACIGGTALAFVVYLLWQMTVHGTVSLENGLLDAFKKGEAATHVFSKAVGCPWIEFLACIFGFFALVTSFLGISLGLYDFLGDGLRLGKKGIGSLVLGGLIIVPTFLGAVNFERVFLTALDLSGGFGDAILNGIMPILMVSIGRYHLRIQKHADHSKKAKWFLAGALMFYFLSLGIECALRLGFVSF